MQIEPHALTQDGHPHVVKDDQQGRVVVGDQACRGGQLGVTRLAGEGSWEQSGWQGSS